MFSRSHSNSGGAGTIKDLDALLDKCIDRINEGESLEDCLASYPEQPKELEPLLRAVWDARDACSPIPRATAKSAARQRLDAALANSERGLQERRRRPMPLFGLSRAWAAVAVILVLALIGFGLYWMLTPGAAPVVAQANFRLLLSDEENAIGDFKSLEVTITSIGVLGGGESAGWEVIQLEPNVVVDLTRLQGLNAVEIWAGELPEGQYIQVVVYIEHAIGTLRNGETVNVIVASGNLQVSKPFVVAGGDSVVNFVYDVSVLTADNDYTLLPQVDQSGPDQSFHEVGSGELTIQVVAGTVTSGNEITVLLTFEGDPVEGATVTVNGEEIGETDADGLISFIVPYDDELEIEEVLGELDGELDIDLPPLPQEHGEPQQPGPPDETPGPPGQTPAPPEQTPAPPDETPAPPDEPAVHGEPGTPEPTPGTPEPTPGPSGEDELTLQVVAGAVAPGNEITVLVTLALTAIQGATVTVNDVTLAELTDVNGEITLTVPFAEELEIEAVYDALEGELEMDSEQD